MSGRFVYLLENIKVGNIMLREKGIGIVECEKNNSYLVKFAEIIDGCIIPKDKVEFFDPLKTGDQFENKICNRCNRLLKTTEFSINQNGINNRKVRRPSCSECRLLIDGKSVSNTDKILWNKRKPNLEIWECPICKKRTIPGITSKVVLDHDHFNGKPRAWICDSCNTGLGRFNDNVEVLKNAIEYLNNFYKT